MGLSPPDAVPCPPQVTISTTDRRNNKLIFKVNLLEMESRILVDFRLSKVGAGGTGGAKQLTVGRRAVREGKRWVQTWLVGCGSGCRGECGAAGGCCGAH